MKNTQKIWLLGIALSFSFISFSQYRFDTGVKVSSSAIERFQLEQRYHLNSPYSLLFAYTFGTEYFSTSDTELSYLDSTLSTYSSFYHSQTHILKFGVQRTITNLASDVFYLGGNIGFGFRQYQSSIENFVYSLNDSTAFNPPHFEGDFEMISNTFDNTISNALLSQLGVTFGMDVPLTNRFLINVELGVQYYFGTFFRQKSFFSEMIPAISGGFRYQFGRQKS